jgi:hypothetical protein
MAPGDLRGNSRNTGVDDSWARCAPSSLAIALIGDRFGEHFMLYLAAAREAAL